MHVEIHETVASDAAVAALIEAQEREVMSRYDTDDPGPAPDPSALCLVASLDGEPVGCVVLARLHGRTGEIKRMFVAHTARRRGIAQRLLERAEDLAAREGFESLRLETGTGQPEAVALYESSGWSRIPVYGHFADDPTTICMQKPVGAVRGET